MLGEVFNRKGDCMKRLLFFGVVISVLMMSCAIKEQENITPPSSIPSQPEMKGSKLQAQDMFDYSQWSIQSYLAKMENIALETWSLDQKKVAYIVLEQCKATGKLFIWQEGEQEPKAVQELEKGTEKFYWSPDSHYLIADRGASATRQGKIIDVSTYTQVVSINYRGKPVWSPDGNWVALGQARSLETAREGETKETVDLVMYNIASRKTKVIKQGDQKEKCRPLNWQKDGVLEYVSDQRSGASYSQWYLPSEFKKEFERQIIQQYISPSKKHKIFLVKNIDGYHLYVQNERYFTHIKGYSYFGEPGLSWSPKEKYLLIETKGSEFSWGYIFDLVNGKGIGQVEYLSGPFWSPGGDYLSFTKRGEEIPDAAQGRSSFANDLYIYDLELANYYSCILKGTADFSYAAEGWGQEGVKYSKIENASGRILEKGKYVYARNIVSLNLDTGDKEVLEEFTGRKYANFNYSSDKKYISLIKHHPSFGDALPGNLAIYNTETGEIKDLDIVFYVWGGWEETWWFNDSAKVIIDQQEILDIKTGEVTEIEVAENEQILGTKPAPNDTRIAMFSYYHKENAGDDMGIPLNLYIMDSNGKEVLHRYETDLLPFFNNNTQSLLPVKFTWLDNNTVVLESWREQYKVVSDIYKIDVNTGKTKKLVENAHSPSVAPDGTKIVVVKINRGSVYFPQDIEIIDSDGKFMKTLNCEDFALDSFATDMMWSDDATKLLITGYKEENQARDKYVVVYDLVTENSRTVQLGDSELSGYEKKLLWISDDGKKIVYSQLGNLGNP